MCSNLFRNFVQSLKLCLGSAALTCSSLNVYPTGMLVSMAAPAPGPVAESGREVEDYLLDELIANIKEEGASGRKFPFISNDLDLEVVFSDGDLEHDNDKYIDGKHINRKPHTLRHLTKPPKLEPNVAVNFELPPVVEQKNEPGYVYQMLKNAHHLIHVIKIDPKIYSPQLVRANQNSGGVEQLDNIARFWGANIAINAIFFQISRKSSKMGRPTQGATFIVEGKNYGNLPKAEEPMLNNNKQQALVILDKGKLLIEKGYPLSLGDPLNYETVESLKPKHIESSDFKEVNVPAISVFSTTPLLVSNGKIVEELVAATQQFYKRDCARSALGLLPDGSIMLISVETAQTRDIINMPWGEIWRKAKRQDLYKTQFKRENVGDLTLNEVDVILRKQDKVRCKIRGLSISQLAHCMQKLGCVTAINLDGGGSSTLWLKDRIINRTLGKEDGTGSPRYVRPIAAALLFHKALPLSKPLASKPLAPNSSK